MIFIIGGKGFVGSAYGRYAQENGLEYAVIEQDNYESFYSKECDILINANGNSKKFLANEDPLLEYQLSVLSVMNSLHRYKVKKYVLVSTIDVYNDVTHPENNHEETVIDPYKLSNYGFNKYNAEMLVKKYAPNWLIIRSGGFVGTGLKKNAIYDILHDNALWIDKESKYQYINTNESARLVFKLLNASIEKTIVNVCGDGCISIGEIAQMCGKSASLAFAQEKPRHEHYEVNIDKLKTITEVPKTRDMVSDFIKSI